MQGFEQNNDPADIIRYTKEWDFYGMFGVAALGGYIKHGKRTVTLLLLLLQLMHFISKHAYDNVNSNVITMFPSVVEVTNVAFFTH